MPQSDQGLVDLLEIYHARQVRDEVLAHLRRLHRTDAMSPLQDELRRSEIASYYEAMLLTAADLLDSLGDENPLD